MNKIWLYLKPFRNIRQYSRFSFCEFKKKYTFTNNTKILETLKSLGLYAKERVSGGIVTETCPLCPKPHNNDPTNHWTLNFKENNGAFLCFRCGNSGSWKTFINKTGISDEHHLHKDLESKGNSYSANVNSHDDSHKLFYTKAANTTHPNYDSNSFNSSPYRQNGNNR